MSGPLQTLLDALDATRTRNATKTLSESADAACSSAAGRGCEDVSHEDLSGITGAPNVHDGRWGRLMAGEYRPASEPLRARPVRSWTDCVELAETIWTFWGKETRDWDGLDRPTGRLSAKPLVIDAAPVVALVEGVPALGGGERFDPRTAWWDREDTP
jgi:hypothetical protein